jgi:chemotaxis signal transduction protein
VSSVVRFRTADGEFAVAVEDAREVRTTSGMLPVPTPGPDVVGFLAHDDRSLTVVAPLGAGRDQVLVLDPEGQPFGLLVEEVTGVTTLDEADVGPPPAGQSGDFVSGVVAGADGLVLLVDARALARTLSG